MPAESFRAALAALDQRPLDAALKQELRRQVCDYVDDAHRAQWPPERMLVEVKQILRASGYRSPGVTSGKYKESRDALVEEIVQLCIVEYFHRGKREE